MRDRRGLKKSPMPRQHFSPPASALCPSHSWAVSGASPWQPLHPGQPQHVHPSGPHARDATLMSTHTCTCPGHVCALQTQLSFPQAGGECTWKVVTKWKLLFLWNTPKPLTEQCVLEVTNMLAIICFYSIPQGFWLVFFLSRLPQNIVYFSEFRELANERTTGCLPVNWICVRMHTCGKCKIS